MKNTDNLNKQTKTPLIIGVILLIFAIMELIGFIAIIGIQFFDTYGDYLLAIYDMGLYINFYLAILGVIASLGLLYTSLLLIRYKDKGRYLFNIYLIYLLIMTPLFYWGRVSQLLRDDTFSNGFDLASALIPSIIITILSLIIFVLFWYFLNKKKTKQNLL